MTHWSLIQIREIVRNSLVRTAKLSKSFQSFFIETMQLYLTIHGRINFTQLARFGNSCESRFRQNIRKSVDWIAFSRTFGTDDNYRLWAIAIAPSYISKSGKKTPGLSSWTALTFAFNMSLSSINVARAFARQNNYDISIGSVKTLLHNAAMMERFISTFGKRPNLNFNNTDFNELLFYGVRNAS